MSQPQPSAETAGTPLPLSLEDAVPAVPDPVEVYVVKADGGGPKLITATLGTPTWSWSPDDEHAALITDITDHSARLRLISLKDAMELGSVDINDYPRTATVVAERRVGGLGGLDGKRRDHRSDAGRWVGQAAANDDAGSRKRLVDGGRLGKRRQAAGPSLGEGSDSQAAGVRPGERRAARGGDAAGVGAGGRIIAETARRRHSSSTAWELWIVRDRLATVYLLSISASGSVRQVLDGRCGLESAAWSPDGKQIAYGVMTSDDSRGVYSAGCGVGNDAQDVGGSSTAFDTVEGWSPDGERGAGEPWQLPDLGLLHGLLASACAGPG